jgi:hypothetical protein
VTKLIRNILKKILNVKELEYDGIPASELVKVESKWYDSYCSHKVVWEDIYLVYQLAKENTDESIKTLTKRFSLKDTGYSINVKLRTPIFDRKENAEYYHTFSLDEAISFYKQAHENRIKEAEWQEQRKQSEIKVMKKNEIPSLKESISKILKE